MTSRSYDEAISCLNTLQSSASDIQNSIRNPPVRGPRKLELVCEYLSRVGYSPSDLNKLNVVHVTGTKGKGSTCAMVDSILRHVNPKWKTGLYTSPHLIAVRERIRINGVPLSKELFTKYFFEVWDNLGNNTDRSEDAALRPMYFRFLTIMAFHTFLSMKVDATILEVGIGGLLDDTNIVPHPIVTGVASIGFDHMGILGSTLSEIAYQKAGIFKNNVPAFTIDQTPEALASMQRQAVEREAAGLQVVSPTGQLSLLPLGIRGQHQIQNAALAVHLSDSFTRQLGMPDKVLSGGEITPSAVNGLEAARWPGRCQTVPDPLNANLTWFLDGAHTEESLECCIQWFASREAALSAKPSARLLIFNITKGRSGHDFLRTILQALDSQLEELEPGTKAADFFTHVIFCPNVTYQDGGFKKDLLSVRLSRTEQDILHVQKELAEIWLGLVPGFVKSNVHVVPSIEHAVNTARSTLGDNGAQVLVTGSMHLVGGAIEVASLADLAFKTG